MRESTCNLVMVGCVGTETKLHLTLTLARDLLSARAALLMLVNPTRRALALREAIFIATLAAPPGRFLMVFTLTTGTGAFGEIRLVGLY